MDVPYFIQSSRPFKKIQRGIISNRVNLISGVLGKKIEPVIYDSKVSPTEAQPFLLLRKGRVRSRKNNR